MTTTGSFWHLQPCLNSLGKDCYCYFMYHYILHTCTENNRVYPVVSLGMCGEGVSGLDQQARMEITSNELGNITPSCKLINSNTINVNYYYPEVCTIKYYVKNGGHRENRLVMTLFSRVNIYIYILKVLYETRIKLHVVRTKFHKTLPYLRSHQHPAVGNIKTTVREHRELSDNHVLWKKFWMAINIYSKNMEIRLMLRL
jgi:hypothetical protein